MATGLFGIASTTGIMPGTLQKPTNAGGIIHVEAFCSNAATNATVQIIGSVSGSQWRPVGAAIVLTGATPAWQVVTGVNYSIYQCNVTAISGGGQVTVYLGN